MSTNNFDNLILITPSAAATAAREERMIQCFSPDHFNTPGPHGTRYSTPSSPPSVSRNKRKISKSYFTDDDGEILDRFFIPCLDEAFEEKSESKSSYLVDLQQRLSRPAFYDQVYSLSLSDVSSTGSGSVTPFKTLSSSKHTPLRRLSLTQTGQGKMSRRNSGSALAA
jgi:hypothetical protein